MTNNKISLVFDLFSSTRLIGNKVPAQQLEIETSLYSDDTSIRDVYSATFNESGEVVFTIDLSTNEIIAMSIIHSPSGNIYYYVSRDELDEKVKKNLEDYVAGELGERVVKLELFEDAYEKAEAIILNKEFNTKVLVPLDLSEKEINQLKSNANELNMTLDEYVELLMLRAIESANDIIAQEEAK